MSYKQLFTRFLSARPERLHFAAHSHHFWPDVAFDAHCQAWTDAAVFVDDKWEHVFDVVVPTVQKHIARILSLPDPASIAFAPNTHELLKRVMSCLPATKQRILTTDGEFHSFNRQCRRWEEAGRVVVERVPIEPFHSFADRFLEAAAGDFDMIFTSHVFFNSGFVFDRFRELSAVVANDETFIVIDGYHAFMALPTNLDTVCERMFYLAGGYKYAMSGEGVCFLHCPSNYGPRPVDTGWFAGFAALQDSGGNVAFASDGSRFLGSTFDPSGMYRFNAVQTKLLDLKLGVSVIHEHVVSLQEHFLDSFTDSSLELVPGRESQRGHFLTFRCQDAEAWVRGLKAADVIVDRRGNRLRFGFGLYHDASDVDQLVKRLAAMERPADRTQ